MTIHDARVRDDDAPNGARVLIDRLWPRGVSKADAALDLWAKDLAPSSDLRSWYHEDREDRFSEFTSRYEHELDDADLDSTLEELRSLAKDGPIVLMTDAKDVEHSHLPTLKSWLEREL